MSESMQMSVDNLENKTGDDFDKAFIDEMIVHHQGAIDMARLAAQNAQHVEIKQLSTDIITAQEKEIEQMKQWQRAWGYSSSDSDHVSH